MKFLVDSLPYYMADCPFMDNCPISDDECPRHWDKYDIEDSDHECYWLKEQEDKE